AFIVTATTFTSGPLAGYSPYVMTPQAAKQVLDQAAGEAWNAQYGQPTHHACANTTCLLMGANMNLEHPQVKAEVQRRRDALLAAGVVITAPATLAALSTP